VLTRPSRIALTALFGTELPAIQPLDKQDGSSEEAVLTIRPVASVAVERARLYQEHG
jgi:hypothetical protein